MTSVDIDHIEKMEKAAKAFENLPKNALKYLKLESHISLVDDSVLIKANHDSIKSRFEILSKAKENFA